MKSRFFFSVAPVATMKSRVLFSVASVAFATVVCVAWLQYRISRLGVQHAVETVLAVAHGLEQQPPALDTGPHPPYFREDSAPVAWQNITYRYPTHFFANLNSWETPTFPHVITGVLSANSGSKYRSKRDSIRNTWAHQRSDIVFLVAGPWDDIRDEFQQHLDIFWVDREEAYTKITWKVQTFFSAVDKHVQNYGHVLKTDDDSYVNIGDVSRASQAQYRHTDYIGLCMSGEGRSKELLEEYPPYASGSGYLLSKSLLACFTNFVPTSLSITTEDALSGILANACNVQCTTSAMMNPWRRDTDLFHTKKDFWTQHYVLNEDEMAYLHWMACNSVNNSEEVSCGIGSKKIDHLANPAYCGGHRTESCGQCPQGHGKEWCHGDCHWCEYGVTEGINSTFTSTMRAELDQCVSSKHTCKQTKDNDVVKENEEAKEEEEEVSIGGKASEEDVATREDDLSKEDKITKEDDVSKEDEATAKDDDASKEDEATKGVLGAKQDEAKKGQEERDTVLCGGHRAGSCDKCPQGHGEKWCHGDCHWCDDGQTDKNSSSYNAQCLPALQECKAK